MGLSVPGASGVEPVMPPTMLSAIMRAVHTPQAGASQAVTTRLASRLPPLQVRRAVGCMTLPLTRFRFSPTRGNRTAACQICQELLLFRVLSNVKVPRNDVDLTAEPEAHKLTR